TNNRTASEEEDEKLWNSINDVNVQLNSVFQSVSDGKTSIGATLTELGIPTLSDASFESITSNIRATAAAHYSNGYNDGYTTGKAEGIAEGQQAEVIYTYHDHTGSAADGSGCFTEPLYHAHTEECYRDTYRQCESTRWNNLYYSWDHDYDYPDMGKWHSDFYGGTCSVCGAQNNYNAASYNTPGGWDYRRCGASIYNGQQLVCTKSTESVEGWTAGCGYTDHQIVKAEILFENQ
ncbi:MAG: hypothetical protein HUJ75_04540, partial [Parasporobacterium sp.]|nr:hypothetical protein [Parasporobacterium sp.]